MDLDAKLEDRFHLRAVSLLLTVLVFAHIFWFQLHLLDSNEDVSTLLTTASRVWDGEILYRDIFEVNPPFSVWLYMPNMALEKLAGIRAETSLVFTLPLLALASIAFSGMLLRKYMGGFRQPAAYLAIPALLFLGLCLAPMEFGQREEFALFFFLPWLALFCARDSRKDFTAGNWFSRLVAGLGGGLTMIVKPPFFALPLAIPIMVAMVRRRKIRIAFTPENLIAACVVLGYGAYLYFFEGHYFKYIFPLTRNIYFRYGEYRFMDIIFVIYVQSATIYMAVVSLSKIDNRINLPIKNIIAASIGFSIAYFIMKKLWFHHAIPFIALSIGAIFLMNIFIKNSVKDNTFTLRRITVALSLSAILLSMQIFSIVVITSPIRNNQRATAILSQVPNATIASISPALRTAFPLIRQAKGRFVSKYVCSWLVEYAAIFEARAGDVASRRYYETVKTRTIDEYESELRSKNPDFILDSPREINGMQNILPGVPGIREILKDYKQIYSSRTLIIYQRHDLPNAVPSASGKATPMEPNEPA